MQKSNNCSSNLSLSIQNFLYFASSENCNRMHFWSLKWPCSWPKLIKTWNNSQEVIWGDKYSISCTHITGRAAVLMEHDWANLLICDYSLVGIDFKVCRIAILFRTTKPCHCFQLVRRPRKHYRESPLAKSAQRTPSYTELVWCARGKFTNFAASQRAYVVKFYWIRGKVTFIPGAQPTSRFFLAKLIYNLLISR